MGPEQGSNASEGHTGPSGAISPVVWVDCEDYQGWSHHTESLRPVVPGPFRFVLVNPDDGTDELLER
jgi:hypothetical protein